MTVFELSLHRATGGVAPRAEWAAPVVELFDHCRLWEYWSEYLGVDSAVSYGGVGAAGSMVPYGDGDVDRLLAAVDAGEVSLMSAHRFAATSLSGPGGFVEMTYLFAYEPEDRVWIDAWGGGSGSMAVILS